MKKTAELIEAVVLLSVATGSLNLYGGAIIWTGWFNNNAMALCRLFQPDALLSKEGLDLLSAIPECFTDVTLVLGRLKGQIEDANRIIVWYMDVWAITVRGFPTHLKPGNWLTGHLA